MHTRSVNIRVVAYRGEHEWVAQALEYDIAAQAGTRDEVQQEFVRIITAHIHLHATMGRDPFEGVPSAPTHFFDMFERAGKQESARPCKAKFDVSDDPHGAHVELAFA